MLETLTKGVMPASLQNLHFILHIFIFLLEIKNKLLILITMEAIWWWAFLILCIEDSHLCCLQVLILLVFHLWNHPVDCGLCNLYIFPCSSCWKTDLACGLSSSISGVTKCRKYQCLQFLYWKPSQHNNINIFCNTSPHQIRHIHINGGTRQTDIKIK